MPERGSFSGRVYEKGTRDGKRLFGKYNNLGKLDRYTYQETSSDRTSANVSKDPNDISDTYKGGVFSVMTTPCKTTICNRLGEKSDK